MAILVDTNVFLRSVQPHHPQNPLALTALKLLAQDKEPLVIVPQIVVEFWTTATRPTANNGLGLTPEQTKVEVEKILNTFQLFPETPAIFDEWRRLVVSHAVSGLDAHDARIVAAMFTHGIAQILTFNEEDFRRYKEITVFTPQSILSARSATS
jgi:predicted nucleic acid-binding protein